MGGQGTGFQKRGCSSGVLQFAPENIHDQGMICQLLFRSLAVSVALITFAWAGIVEDIPRALEQNNFAAANAELQSDLGQRAVTPEYVEAYSWLARAALTTRQYDQAA